MENKKTINVKFDGKDFDGWKAWVDCEEELLLDYLEMMEMGEKGESC